MKLTKKIEIKLTERDKEYINSVDSTDICRYLESLRDKKFKIGDVLIKKKRKAIYNGSTQVYDHEWVPVVVPYRNVPAKYIVVYIDDHGIPVVKRLSVTGKLTRTIQSLADIDFRTEIFQEDPDYAESMILGDEEFDPIKNERDGWRKS